MFSSDADLFFTSPGTPPQVPDIFGILYLLRRDVFQCLGLHPATREVVGDRIILPGAMAILAGVDLLAKFHSGSDGNGVGSRFKRFLEAYFELTGPDDGEILYQLRCALLHSFGLYSRARDRDYHFHLTRNGEQLVASSGEYHCVDVIALHQQFERSIDLYQQALDASPALQANFAAMSPRYGTMHVG